MELNCTTFADDYRPRYKVFLQKTQQGKKLCEALKELIPKALKCIGLDFTELREYKVLSFGSSDGTTDIDLLKLIRGLISENAEAFGTHGPIKIFNRAIEPDECSLELYKTAVNNLPEDLSSDAEMTEISFEIGRPRTTQEYIAENSQAEPNMKFDMIHLIHSIYYLHEDLENVLKHCYERELGDKGIIICVFANAGDLMSIVKNENAMSYMLPQDRTNDVLEIAEKYGWQYDSHIKEHYYDVSDAFDEKSTEGNLLLDFLVFKNRFRSLGKSEDIDKFVGIIKKNSLKSQRIIIIYKK